jgi:hypothetical protein
MQKKNGKTKLEESQQALGLNAWCRRRKRRRRRWQLLLPLMLLVLFSKCMENTVMMDSVQYANRLLPYTIIRNHL